MDVIFIGIFVSLAVVILAFIGYAATTNKIITGQERELESLRRDNERLRVDNMRLASDNLKANKNLRELNAFIVNLAKPMPQIRVIDFPNSDETAQKFKSWRTREC